MQEAIKNLIITKNNLIENKEQLENIKRGFCKKYKLKAISNAEILAVYQELLRTNKIKRSFLFEKIIRKRAIRTLSGIAPVAVLTKPYKCPGTCAYCPRQEDVPVSYLSNEPAVMRAIYCSYDPYKQITWRLHALENNGHEPTKIEVIVMGGTWSYLPKKYKYWYITNCFQAVNNYQKLKNKAKRKKDNSFSLLSLNSPIKKNLKQEILEKLLHKEQRKNEKSKYKIIGLTLETRPDYITENELQEMRDLGCTRIEIGVQAIDDEILKINKRGHGVKEIVKATSLMRKYGFKITYHFMPALPGSSPDKDFKMFKKMFSDSRFQPDQIKFYPTVVVRGSLLYKWYKQGKYKAYSDKELQNLIIKCKAIVPKYVRIIRLIRDIPGESIVAGNKITNLRQVMKDKGVKCNCIRCREVKDEVLKVWQIEIEKYQASSGTEFFISADSKDKKTLYGFCRLRVSKNDNLFTAIVRELHVYGQLVSIGEGKKIQHTGLGKKLLQQAEEIVQEKNIDKLAIISGVGVRGYYRKHGYKLEKSYMIKRFKK